MIYRMSTDLLLKIYQKKRVELSDTGLHIVYSYLEREYNIIKKPKYNQTFIIEDEKLFTAFLLRWE